jgi:hypothetical protein
VTLLLPTALSATDVVTWHVKCACRCTVIKFRSTEAELSTCVKEIFQTQHPVLLLNSHIQVAVCFNARTLLSGHVIECRSECRCLSVFVLLADVIPWASPCPDKARHLRILRSIPMTKRILEIRAKTYSSFSRIGSTDPFRDSWSSQVVIFVLFSALE